MEYITIDCGFRRGVKQESTIAECSNYLIKNNFKMIDTMNLYLYLKIQISIFFTTISYLYLHFDFISQLSQMVNFDGEVLFDIHENYLLTNEHSKRIILSYTYPYIWKLPLNQ